MPKNYPNLTLELISQDQHQIAYVTLNRADKHNGLTLPMLQALADLAHDLGKNCTVRAVILQGTGESFCAGLDFKTVTKTPFKILQAFRKPLMEERNLFQEAIWAWRVLPMPVIAVVQGACFGGGLQLALAADFRFARADSQWAIMESKWGLIPDMTGAQSLAELMRHDLAKKYAMTGEVFSGDVAEKLGLITEISDQPLDLAKQLLDKLVTRSPEVLAATKQLFDESGHLSPNDTFALERKLQLKLLFSKNQKRAMQAAFKKAMPDFLPRKW